MQAAVTTKGLEVRYGDNVALTGLDLSLPVASSLAVVGPNGSGKSTLLGALAGLHKPSAGTAHVLGEKPSLVLQATELDAGLPITVLDAVKLARYPSLGLLGRFRQADHHAVNTALERMHVDSMANKALHHLSGGQRQRVLMAQGLAQQSQVLLLDEPMTGLDVTSRQVVLDVVAEELAADRTVIMTTHSLADARECNYVLLLDTAPVAFGTPDDVLTVENLRRTFDHGVVHVGEDIVLNDHHVH